MPYVEPGGSWRPFWLAAGVLGLLAVLDAVLPGIDVPPPLWALAALAVPGVVAAVCLAARRAWTVRVDPGGPDGALSVGRERVALADVDAAHLRAVREGTAGVDAGAPVLGGGWTVPRGRSGLPLRLADGRTVLVPTRDPAALGTALLGAVPARATSQRADPDAPDGRPGGRRTLGP
ncbi:hypothetical protein SAMN05660690_0630 [Geodermatophilus telluris]|uniref:Uncharacterized protein n=1 Tax=Geodermatophilus telluris TaxID=1190417 RepID=A0A1G6J2H6_9ACTN|nr:hypothetical protein [Geodermatophilus telluris]SDC12847.1 hypothetical protein SAMN05660690_0630 [Geodermatophilus telluris]